MCGGGGGGARKSARASGLPLCFSAASKERCRTKNGCSCACGRARLVGCSNYHKISSLCARQHFYLQRRRRMERAAFLFLYIRRVNGIELDLDVRALPLLTLTVRRAACSQAHALNALELFPLLARAFRLLSV
jgi:hypothetical protein